MDIIEHYRLNLVIKKQFSCNAVPLLRPTWPKITQKCVYGDEMFLSTISLKHPSPVNCELHINHYTSVVQMQHLCITASKYGGLYRTLNYICKTQYFVDFSRHTSAKM